MGSPESLRALLAAATAALVTLALAPAVRLVALRFGWTSKPVDDRWGRRVVARLGGVAMCAGLCAGILCWVPLTGAMRGLLAGLGLMFLLGLFDDLRRMTPYTKLIGQLGVGCIVVAMGIRFDLPAWPWVSIPLSIWWFVLVVNAFNLLDNMDGLAAGVGAIAAFFCAYHAAAAGEWVVATVAMAVAGASCAFLRYNFPPARIFMGDSGSHLLGLSLAALALMGSWHSSTQLLSVLAIPVLVLAVPIFDTCFVVLQRLLHHQHPFTGGTDHVSHRLAILGLSTRQTVMALYLVGIGFGLLSVLSRELPHLWVVPACALGFAGLLLIGLYLSRVQVYRMSEAAVVPPQGPVTLIQTMLVHKRRVLEVMVDFVLLGVGYVGAHLLRFEGLLSRDIQQLVFQSLPVILLLKLSCLAGFGLYRGVWRYLGLQDLLQIFKAVSLGSMLSALALLFLSRFDGYSRAVFIIDWMLCVLLVGGSRIVERLMDEWVRSAARRPEGLLIIGAGDTGERVLRYLRQERAGALHVVGFVDDDPRKQGATIHGCRVLGTRAQLDGLIARHQVRELWVAITDPPGALLEQVRACGERHEVRWKAVSAGVFDAA